MTDPRRKPIPGKHRTSTRRRKTPVHPSEEEKDLQDILQGDQGDNGNSESDIEEIVGEFPETKEKIDSEIVELRDRLMRLQAEFDNFRKRQARDFKRLCSQGKKELINELLAVLDNYHRAEQLRDEGGHPVKEIAEGLFRTSGQLAEILRQEGLHPLDVKVNDPFDPNIHEAMLAEEIDDLEQDTVMDIFQKGYMLGDELLRPARVKVGKPVEPVLIYTDEQTDDGKNRENHKR